LTALSDHSSHVTRSDGKRYRQGSRNIWVKPVVELAIETAARRGELLSLRWENIDLKRRTAHLPETKNGDSRTVPLSSRAVAILEALPRSIEGKVFPLTVNALKLAFVRACLTAGLENFHFHDLRHEGTSRLAGKLSNVLELSAVTGHKELKMLKRYYHPRAEDLALKLG
jgi:integrase